MLFTIFNAIKLFFILLMFKNIYSYEIKIPGFLQNSNIHTKFNNILQNKYKNPIILDGVKSQFKKEFCEAISYTNKINFIEFTFDEFMIDLPHVSCRNCIIYVNDFLVGNGRILNYYEEMILKYIDKDTNLIVFNSDDIHKITFKDNSIIRLYETFRFPTILKKDLVKYINLTILKYEYHDFLYKIDWNKYNFQNMNFEKTNILLFEVNKLLQKYKYSTFNNINELIDIFINKSIYQLSKC